MMRIEVNHADVQAALNKLLDAVASLEPVFRDIGEYLTDSTKQRFVDGKAPDGTAWKANRKSTLARKKGNKPLIGENKRLSNELHYALFGNGLEFGSSMEYAAVQQFGATKGDFGKTKRGSPIPWGNIPARPFLGISDDDRDAINQTLVRHLLG